MHAFVATSAVIKYMASAIRHPYSNVVCLVESPSSQNWTVCNYLFEAILNWHTELSSVSHRATMQPIMSASSLCHCQEHILAAIFCEWPDHVCQQVQLRNARCHYTSPGATMQCQEYKTQRCVATGGFMHDCSKDSFFCCTNRQSG